MSRETIATSLHARATLAILLGVLWASGCSGFSGRAAAPDERGGDSSPVGGQPPAAAGSGSAVVVHIESTYPATVVRLDQDDRIVHACQAPCDSLLPLEGRYRIDGPAIRSTWPFQLDGAPGQYVTVTVSPETRAYYANARALGAIGGVAMALGLGVALGGAIAQTSAHDANGGSPASCTGCTVAFAGGGILALIGVGLSTAAVVMGISSMSSGTSQRARY